MGDFADMVEREMDREEWDTLHRHEQFPFQNPGLDYSRRCELATQWARQEAELPGLTGSPRQVAYGELVRALFVSRYFSQVVFCDEGDPEPRASLSRELNASWWINAKNARDPLEELWFELRDFEDDY